mgnify:CR=1 FL=1
MTIQELKQVCKNVRIDILDSICGAGSGHIGGSFSMVEIFVALYYDVMNVDPANPKMENRDRFVLSKGHACPCLYAVLAGKGYFPKNELKRERKFHSILQGHPDSKKCPGVEASSGSLGQGISIAAGMALGAKVKKTGAQVYTVIGDGECAEGLVWEAAEAAAHYKLDNFTVILDHNGLQIDGANKDVMDTLDIRRKFEAFGFETISVDDGNDIEQVLTALKTERVLGKPRFIDCHTIKGKGVSFMENSIAWHAKLPNADEYKRAIAELEAAE